MMVTPSNPSPPADHRFALLLEDDPGRVKRFTNVLNELMPKLQLICWCNAFQMIREADAYLPHTCLISLDHDLYPPAHEPADAGDGLMVARFLAQRQPACPIIIHSSNADRANMMAGECELAGLTHKPIAPFGHDWIEVHWARVVQTLLQIGNRK